MKKKRKSKEVIIRDSYEASIVSLVGTKGLEKLKAIAVLVDDESAVTTDYHLIACRILWKGIEKIQEDLCTQLKRKVDTDNE